MGDFELSAERRDQLVALLEELDVRYPAVADYLATVDRLPGADDSGVDPAFDLRLLHYMTDGDSGNPYWDIVAPSVTLGPPERGGRREVNGGRPDGSARLGYAQGVLQTAYAYAIPSPETVAWVVGVSEGRPLVEMGAGRGYWAGLLAQSGLTVSAFDVHPPERPGNTWFPAAVGQRAAWYEVGGLRDLAVARRVARAGGTEGEHVLLLIWPPAWGDPMASRALAAYERAGGDRLVYVGDPEPGGRSGDEPFFERLAAGWELVDKDPDYVAWWNLGDVAQCWSRHR